MNGLNDHFSMVAQSPAQGRLLVRENADAEMLSAA